MSKMSFLQKIGILIDVALSSYWLIIAIGILVAFGVILITNRKKKKQNKSIQFNGRIFKKFFIKII